MRSDHLAKHSKTHEMKRTKKSAKESKASSTGGHQQGDLEPEYDIDIEDVEGDEDDDLSSPKWQLPNHS